MTYVGIDPGLSGAVAILQDGDVELADTPTLSTGKGSRRVYSVVAMRALLVAAMPRLVVIEQQQAMPRQGVSSTFSTGYGFGLWTGLLAGLEIRYEVVTPRRWQKDLGIPPKSGKAGAAELAGRVWPNATIYGPKGGLLDGRADALCLAEWGRRHHG